MMKLRFAQLLSAAALLAAGSLLTNLEAADWPQWRGPDRNDHSPDRGLLKSWPEVGPKRVWLNTDVGLGYSGYAIVGDKLFTMGLRDDTDLVIAVDANTGKELWATKVGARYENRWGDGPRCTPTVDGDRVYALGGQGDLVCLQAPDGKQVWSVSLVSEFGGVVQNWGFTESVLIDGDLVICTPGGGQSTLAALDKATGKTRWKTGKLDDNAHYSSPIVIEHRGKRQYVKLTEKKVFGVAADTGELLWQADFAGRTAVIPTPIYADGQVYVAAGYGVGCLAVKIADDSKSAEVVYENKVMKNHHGGVIKVGDHLYGYSDGPGWVCQDWKTGAEVWASDGLGKGAVHYADGMLYCLDENRGTVVLAEASPGGWKEHGRFTLDPQTSKRSPQGRIWTHPVVVNGKLYLRDQEILHCYDVKAN